MSSPLAHVHDNVVSIQLGGIRRWNIIAGFAHLAQMIAILVLANGFTLPVTATYMAGPPGTPPAEPVVLFDSRIAWGVALFFGLSADVTPWDTALHYYV
jgi:hypothetical protein